MAIVWSETASKIKHLTGSFPYIPFLDSIFLPETPSPSTCLLNSVYLEPNYESGI